MESPGSGSATNLPMYAQIAEALASKSKKSTGKESFPPSVRDVAGQFGVSIVTASRAIQVLKERINKNGISDLASSAEVGNWYVALNVTPGPHQAVGIQIASNGFNSIASQTKAVFHINTIPLNDETRVATIERALESAQVRGLYMLPSRASDEFLQLDMQLIDACRKLKLPVVLIERNLRGKDRPLEHDLVTIHDYDGGRKVTNHLLERNCQRIAFVTASPTSSHQERLAGYFSSVFEAGQQPIVIEYPTASLPKPAFNQVADALLKAGVDGVVCYHDHAAFGVIMELLKRGISVPKQVAVAGFDNMAICESYSIGVTSYAFPYDQVARRAVDLMHLRLLAPNAEPVKMVVPGKIIIRDSTAID